MRTSRSGWRLLWVLAVLALIAAACGDTADTTTTTTAAATTTTAAATTTTMDDGVLRGDERCAANREAGTITFTTGFGFFPSVSVAEVIAADELGYFEEMCLDVEIVPSLPGESMVLVSSNVVQFTANSFGSLAQASTQGAQATMVVNWGHVPIHILIVEEDSGIENLEDFRDTLIGAVGGSVPAPLQSILVAAGLRQGVDYEVVARGFNPFVLTEMDAISAFRSNEPDSLTTGGLAIRIFAPEDYGGTGSFGGILASNEFLRLHPTASEDFVRAAVRGWQYALENGEEVVGFSEALTAGDFNFDHELFRWTTESEIAVASTPEGALPGATDPGIVGREIARMVQLGLITGGLPDVLGLYDNSYIESVYDDAGMLIWPGPMGE